MARLNVDYHCACTAHGSCLRRYIPPRGNHNPLPEHFKLNAQPRSETPHPTNRRISTNPHCRGTRNLPLRRTPTILLPSPSPVPLPLTSRPILRRRTHRLSNPSSPPRELPPLQIQKRPSHASAMVHPRPPLAGSHGNLLGTSKRRFRYPPSRETRPRRDRLVGHHRWTVSPIPYRVHDFPT
jgi:hypothetical protein